MKLFKTEGETKEDDYVRHLRSFLLTKRTFLQQMKTCEGVCGLAGHSSLTLMAVLWFCRRETLFVGNMH